MDSDYSKREIDEMIRDIYKSLERIEVQTTKHNGRMSRVEKILLIVGTVVAVLLFTSGSEFFSFLKFIVL